MIAHKRDDDEIARHIGAEKVIFQELEDLISACAAAVWPGTTARKDQEFEVGVFNGKYVTPVPDGYFIHLEKIRGETKKMKVMESAREAVANGSAGKLELDITTRGVQVNGDGKVIPAAAVDEENTSTDGSAQLGIKKQIDVDEEQLPTNRMDIGMHNQADFEYIES